MKILIAALLSLAFIQLVPNQPPQHINNTVQQKHQAAKTVEVSQATVPTEPAAPVAIPEPQTMTPIPDHTDLMNQAGISPEDQGAASYIMSNESGWCPLKWEGDIGFCPDSYREKYSPENNSKGYGLCQSTPAIKMELVSADWNTNPVTQLKWCGDYALSRYGGWQGAYAHWVEAHRW